MRWYLLTLSVFLLFIFGCQREEKPGTSQPEPSQTKETTQEFKGCQTCHPSVRQDINHTFSCTECHKGNDKGTTAKTAHAGLINKPAHPDFMEKACGGCHKKNVENCQNSLHFTLRNKITKIRTHFDTSKKALSIADIESSAEPASPEELVDDLLRRRCLRCHLFYSGDTYANTQRGTGCAACHMGFSNGELASHEFLDLPGDIQCLACHYANFVGADYYGRYEHDFGNEYRTPFTTRQEYFRPYGVEYHELVPDIHQQRGLACIDCHSSHQTMGTSVSCRSCHQIDQENGTAESLPENVQRVGNKAVLTARLSGNKHPIPQMNHPAHLEFAEKVNCQVCHAQWSFNDTTIHLVRSDSDDFDPWSDQLVQSSSAVENLLLNNLVAEEEEQPPAMIDTVTGEEIAGVWYKGFTERRWERMLIQKDSDGIIKIFRPILDLHLSYIDENEDVIFDNLEGNSKTALPYTPHTTGKAGLFYLERFSHLLHPKNDMKVE